MTLHAEVEEFLRLNELVKAGEANARERTRWEALKARVMSRKDGASGGDDRKAAVGARRRLSRAG